ncbi:response regulator transcription factor [Microbacterium capsulatum]|uniref:Response regulator transcription factor n=1 Tax=Microbacterium capsulatum TaxID=3041921 RepID=A0ABU0XGU9_9MICO|nr:response regulator transcription factor [Microbacterium sp. ASV81]MDQ4214296.1 response regulator transcription factor [Microbacterium sp. ASV81]
MNAAPVRTAVIIEDDPDVGSLLDEVFRSAGFETVIAVSGLDGVDAVAQHRPVITTLDINLPGIDGFEVARRIRRVSPTYILMISALGEETDVVMGLGAGADEYLVKPFRPRELRARIEALLRRPRQSPESPVGAPAASEPARDPAANVLPAAQDATSWRSHRDIRLDPSTHTVLLAQQEVDLTPTEFDLLATLLESKRRVRSKADLALVLRGEEFGSEGYVSEPDKRAVEAHMTNLRRKIGDSTAAPRYIETVRGVGYRLTEYAQSQQPA